MACAVAILRETLCQPKYSTKVNGIVSLPPSCIIIGLGLSFPNS